MFSRSELLLGREAMEKLAHSHVAVFGLGGVGGYICEALARGGVGNITVVDADTVSKSNVNRQIIAFKNTIGHLKTELIAKRLKDINPDIKVFEYSDFFDSSTANKFDFSSFSYVADAIDTVTSKLLLAEICRDLSVPLISSMGTGNKLDPTMFEITDISKTSVCPLARVMRSELRKRGINHLKVLYSKEQPIKIKDDKNGRPSPASVSFVPPVAGLIIAGEIIKDLIK